MTTIKTLMAEIKKESKIHWSVGQSFSAYSCLKPVFIMRCVQLRMSYWEVQSALYSQYVIEKDEYKNSIRRTIYLGRKIVRAIMKKYQKQDEKNGKSSN